MLDCAFYPVFLSVSLSFLGFVLGLDFVNVFRGWVFCRACGFTNRSKKSRQLRFHG